MRLLSRCPHSVRWYLAGVGLLSILLTAPVYGQDDFFSSVSIDESVTTDSQAKPYSLIGWYTQNVTYGTESPSSIFARDKKDLVGVEGSLYAQLDLTVNENTSIRLAGKAFHDEIYRINSRTDYSSDEVNKFRNRFQVRDVYIQTEFDNGSFLKLGNQIAAWGFSEFLRVTDLVNIEDQNTLGQQDLQDIRLQVPGALFSFSWGGWEIEQLVTFQAGRDDSAPAGDEFDQYIRFRNTGINLQRSRPDNEYEYFFRASNSYAGGDIQFVFAEYNDNALSVDKIEGLRSISPRIDLTQNRMRALGMAINRVSGSWLGFAELGLHRDKAIRPSNDAFFSRTTAWQQEDQLLAVIGVEYTGFSNLLLSLETDYIHTSSHQRFMQTRRDQLAVGGRAYWTALNERLELLAVWNQLPNNGGSVGRLSVDYSWSDDLRFGFMWVDYSGTSGSILRDYRNNDVLQVQLRYNFQY